MQQLTAAAANNDSTLQLSCTLFSHTVTNRQYVTSQPCEQTLYLAIRRNCTYAVANLCSSKLPQVADLWLKSA